MFAGTNLPSGAAMNTAGLRRFEPDEEDIEPTNQPSPILQPRSRSTLPPAGYRSDVPTGRLPSTSPGRESRGTQPGTSGMQNRVAAVPPPRLWIPPTSRGANILRLALARTSGSVVSQSEESQISENLLDSQNNLSDSEEEFLFEDITQQDQEQQMLDGSIVDETGTTVTVHFSAEVK